jgi:short-subunit dehydrogenase
MSSFHPRHVLLTGAAGAIGRALVRTLAARHPDLRFTLVDRDEDGLTAVAQTLPDRSAAIPWDLANPATLPALWERTTAGSGAVDLLINCAGFMEIRSFAATSWELGERLLNVDLLTPLRLMQLAVADMAADPSRAPSEPRGWIVNISSMAGRVPLLGCSYYGAAKSGLALASEIIGLELAEKGVHVLTVLPGPVHSELESRARSQVHPGFVSNNIPTGNPEELALAIEQALRLGDSRLVYPGIYRVADLFLGASSAIAAAFSPVPTDTDTQE